MPIDAWRRPTSTKRTPESASGQEVGPVHVSPEGARQDLLRIFRAAVAAVDPSELTCRFLADHPRSRPGRRTLVVGAGKAAARMAAGCEAALGPGVGGLVIVAEGCDVPLASIGVRIAGHPLPDRRGADATEELCRLLGAAGEQVLCLVSGGASSLLVRPRRPVTLSEKTDVNRLLLESGADIAEINTVRKHLSEVKGGGLLRLARTRPLLTLALSDVVGDDPAIIGSGPTTADASTYAEALRVLRKFDLAERVPESVREVLERGSRGVLSETVKPGEPEAAGAETVVIGNNHMALAAAAAAARQLGYAPLIAESPLLGDTSEAARRWLQAVRSVDGRHACAIAGGETTVTVRGRGRGGRNQEFALALVEPIAGTAVALLSAGSDGIDGPTDAAGAFADGRTLERARALGLDPREALADNDSYGFFAPLGDLLRCGPTGTNVMDIKVAVGLPSAD